MVYMKNKNRRNNCSKELNHDPKRTFPLQWIQDKKVSRQMNTNSCLRMMMYIECRTAKTLVMQEVRSLVVQSLVEVELKSKWDPDIGTGALSQIPEGRDQFHRVAQCRYRDLNLLT